MVDRKVTVSVNVTGNAAGLNQALAGAGQATAAVQGRIGRLNRTPIAPPVKAPSLKLPPVKVPPVGRVPTAPVARPARLGGLPSARMIGPAERVLPAPARTAAPLPAPPRRPAPPPPPPQQPRPAPTPRPTMPPPAPPPFRRPAHAPAAPPRNPVPAPPPPAPPPPRPLFRRPAHAAPVAVQPPRPAPPPKPAPPLPAPRSAGVLAARMAQAAQQRAGETTGQLAYLRSGAGGRLTRRQLGLDQQLGQRQQRGQLDYQATPAGQRRQVRQLGLDARSGEQQARARLAYLRTPAGGAQTIRQAQLDRQLGRLQDRLRGIAEHGRVGAALERAQAAYEPIGSAARTGAAVGGGLMAAGVASLPDLSSQLTRSFQMLSREIGISVTPQVVELSGWLQSGAQSWRAMNEATGGGLGKILFWGTAAATGLAAVTTGLRLLRAAASGVGAIGSGLGMAGRGLGGLAGHLGGAAVLGPVAAVGAAVVATAAVDYNMSRAEMERHRRERIGPLYNAPGTPAARSHENLRNLSQIPIVGTSANFAQELANTWLEPPERQIPTAGLGRRAAHPWDTARGIFGFGPMGGELGPRWRSTEEQERMARGEPGGLRPGDTRGGVPIGPIRPGTGAPGVATAAPGAPGAGGIGTGAPEGTQLMIDRQTQMGGDVTALYDRILMSIQGRTGPEAEQEIRGLQRLIETLDRLNGTVSAATPAPIP